MNGPTQLLERIGEDARADFAAAVRAGLRQRPRSIPSRFLYDARGSSLFDAICDLPEYYLTRTETGILRERAEEIARRAGPGVVLVEYGSGSSVKTRLLIEALRDLAAYVPVDVSGEHLEASAARLRMDYPGLRVEPVCADYMSTIRLPSGLEPDARRLGFFPGSTIGNLVPADARAFLRGARQLVGDNGALVLGADLRKDPRLLHAAYNDTAGVTARFTLNLLTRMNRELDADFDLSRFVHEAFYNPVEHRIEIFFRSLCRQSVTIDGETYAFAEGERVHTEYSYKYDAAALAALAAGGGFRIAALWTDPRNLFAVAYLEPA